jgi:beta-phosphoglucomutase-like phosphatase (HAD superfamily)
MLVLPPNGICVLAKVAPRPQISHVIFDFDGTLSWLRHGWPEMMFELFRSHLPPKPDETPGDMHRMLIAEILALNGKPSIFQMLRLCEIVQKRGGVPPDPNKLLEEYQSRLDAAIEDRSQRIARSETSKDEFVVHGARELLEELLRRNITLIILSGTIEHRVKHEAGLLDLARYFRHHIYGSTPDHTQFSKRDVIQRILREEDISGEHLLSFGDGPVEIQFTREAGGLTVGVASNENENGSGNADPHKWEQLFQAGADILIPDYRRWRELLPMIIG